MGARYFYVVQKLDNKLHRYHRCRLVPLWLIRPVCNHYEALLLASGNGPFDASSEPGTVFYSDEEFVAWTEAQAGQRLGELREAAAQRWRTMSDYPDSSEEA